MFLIYFKKSNIHVFGLTNTSSGINVSLAVSYDYEKDVSIFFKFYYL